MAFLNQKPFWYSVNYLKLAALGRFLLKIDFESTE